MIQGQEREVKQGGIQLKHKKEGADNEHKTRIKMKVKNFNRL